MTISAEYLEQQKQLHENPNYGVASLQYAQLALQLIDHMSAKSVSDYGAGKCNLQKKLAELGRSDFQYFPYDPAFPEYGEPKEADLVCCIDVLEHVELPYLEAVLRDLAGHMSLIVVEHDMQFIRDIATEITVMHRGRIFIEGDVAEIMAHAEVQEIYLGKEANGAA